MSLYNPLSYKIRLNQVRPAKKIIHRIIFLIFFVSLQIYCANMGDKRGLSS